MFNFKILKIKLSDLGFVSRIGDMELETYKTFGLNIFFSEDGGLFFVA